MPQIRKTAAAAALLALSLSPGLAHACACGCDVFDVGGPETMPVGKGGELFFEYDYMDQNTNWSNNARSAAVNNSDKEIRTNFITAGVKYTVNQDWGVVVEAPLWNREFHTENDAGTGIDRFNHAALGDVRLTGVYTGLSKDKSTGLIFGVKLATGDWKYPGFDRDTEIGTGSTNILLGAYHAGFLSRDGALGYVVKGLWDKPVAGQGDYMPGQEFDASASLTYDMPQFTTAPVQVVPVLQLLASARAHDTGVNANPTNSGYQRLLVSPGVEFTAGRWSLYADAEVPLYQRFKGQQLTAPVLAKVMVSRRF